MEHKKYFTRLCALALSAAMLLSLAACNKQEKPSDQGSKGEPAGQDAKEPGGNADADEILASHEGPLTEEEYETVLQLYYDDLMNASDEASHKLDEAMAAANEEEKTEVQKNKLEVAKGMMDNMRPLYTRFVGLAAPEAYVEAQALIDTGAAANESVMRIQVEIMDAVKGENGVAEAMVLQKEMEQYTKEALNFSKGLRMVLGESVGVSESSKAEID